MSGSAAPSVAAKFGALRHRDYRRYFLVALLGMTAESVEHVGSYWVIFQSVPLADPRRLRRDQPLGRLRGRVVGLVNTSMLGLRAGSGVTVGVLGAAIGVDWSLALSAAAVVVVCLGLLAADARAARPASPVG